MIIAFGVGWRVTSTTSEAVNVAKSYPAPAALDSLGRYLRPMTLTSSETGTASADLLSTDVYFGPPGASGPNSGGEAPPRAASRPRWIVSAILLTDARRMAVLNDSVVVVGSMTSGGARVIAIESDHVVLQESGGARRVVPLNR